MIDGVAIIERISARGALVKVLNKPHLELTTPLGRDFLAYRSPLQRTGRDPHKAVRSVRVLEDPGGICAHGYRRPGMPPQVPRRDHGRSRHRKLRRVDERWLYGDQLAGQLEKVARPGD